MNGGGNDGNAVQPNAEIWVRDDAEQALEDTDVRVAGRGDRVAARQRPRVTLADRDWIDRRRRVTTVASGHWGSRSSDAAGHGESGDEGDKGLVKHHCDDWMEAVVILKLRFGMGNSRADCLLFYTFS